LMGTVARMERSAIRERPRHAWELSRISLRSIQATAAVIARLPTKGSVNHWNSAPHDVLWS
jgi:hypothetical protein